MKGIYIYIYIYIYYACFEITLLEELSILYIEHYNKLAFCSCNYYYYYYYYIHILKQVQQHVVW